MLTDTFSSDIQLMMMTLVEMENLGQRVGFQGKPDIYIQLVMRKNKAFIRLCPVKKKKKTVSVSLELGKISRRAGDIDLEIIHMLLCARYCPKCYICINELKLLNNINNNPILEQEMATYSSILAWKIPWMEGPGELQYMGLKSRT